MKKHIAIRLGVLTLVLLLAACQEQAPGLAADLPITAPPAVDVLHPVGCETDRALIQDALDQAPAQVALAAGVFCLDGPLDLPAQVSLAGAGREQTVLVQRQAEVPVLRLAHVWKVTVRDLALTHCRQEKERDICAGAETDNDDEWQRAIGIAAYATRGVTVRDITIRGGHYGIALLDHGNLNAPLRGPESAKPMAGLYRFDTCHDGRDNLGWSITGNLIEAAETDGLLIHNLAHSEVARNTLRGAVRFNGIKIGCGPVRDNRFTANYLSDNGFDGTEAKSYLGDGIDVAWAWTHSVKVAEGWQDLIDTASPESCLDALAIDPQACTITLEDPPDGPFSGNLFMGNLVWGNGSGGIAIKAIDPAKAAANQSFCTALTAHLESNGMTPPATLCPDPPDEGILAIGGNTLEYNLLWANGLTPGAETTEGRSQLELRTVHAPGPAPAQRLRVAFNILDAAPDSPANGAYLDDLHGADYLGNWHRGSYCPPECAAPARDLWLGDSFATVAFSRNFADEEDIDSGLPPGWGPVLEPTEAARLTLQNQILATDPYHLADDDNDTIPNAWEALTGSDHLGP